MGAGEAAARGAAVASRALRATSDIPLETYRRSICAMATGNTIATSILERALVHLRASQSEQFASLLHTLLAGHPHVVGEVQAVAPLGGAHIVRRGPLA